MLILNPWINLLQPELCQDSAGLYWVNLTRWEGGGNNTTPQLLLIQQWLSADNAAHIRGLHPATPQHTLCHGWLHGREPVWTVALLLCIHHPEEENNICCLLHTNTWQVQLRSEQSPHPNPERPVWASCLTGTHLGTKCWVCSRCVFFTTAGCSTPGHHRHNNNNNTNVNNKQISVSEGVLLIRFCLRF